MNSHDSLNSITFIFKSVLGLGMAFVLTSLMVDLLFPGTTQVVNHIA